MSTTPSVSLDGPDVVSAGWHRAQLDVSGSAERIDAFREAARGPGAVPWAIDSDADRQNLLARLVAQAAESPIPRHADDLLRAIAQSQDAHHACVLAACATPGGGCALDLQRLLPVPRALLALGADHADSLAWRDAHWGTREAVRHVELRETRDPKQYRRRRLRYRFWMEDARPDRLAASLRQAWPGVGMDLVAMELTDG